jgi:hypothetical protein
MSNIQLVQQIIVFSNLQCRANFICQHAVVVSCFALCSPLFLYLNELEFNIVPNVKIYEDNFSQNL